MALAIYLAFLGACCAFALSDWRRAWFLVIVCGVLQDPVRKLTPGAPVAISFSVVVLYVAILFAARGEILANLAEFGRRFPRLNTAIFVFIALLFVSALNGLMTFGFSLWKVPLVSLFTYLSPLPAVVLGYTWLRREEMLYRFVNFYAAVTSLALVGSYLEYLRVESRVIGLVAYSGDYIRHLPGIQIRLLSGFYRSPDIMAWHAATLTALGVAMALRAGFGRQLWIWSAVAGWGFFACMIGGRRKAVYYVVAFVMAFLWRYLRRLRNAQVAAIVMVLLVLAGVVHNIASDEKTNVYARGATATRTEITERLEGGAIETFRQFGLMGAGLGSATQGTRHLLGDQQAIGWQEGGLGKLAIETGAPGVIATALLMWILIRMLLLLTSIGDVPGSSQFARAMLFGILVANGANFMASAQAYTDAYLGLVTAFLVGCLLATATLDERLADEQGVRTAPLATGVALAR